MYHEDPYSNPFVGSIAQLMQAPAQAQTQSGQLWDRAITNIGQIPGQIQQQQAQQQEQQLRQGEIDKLTQTRNDMKAMDAAFAQPGGRDAVLNALPGHLRPTVAQQLDEADKRHADAAKAQGEADQLLTDAVAGDAADIAAHGNDPMAAQVKISSLKQTYANNPRIMGQLVQAEQAIQANPTADTVKQITDGLIAQSPKQQELRDKAQTLAATIAKNGEDARHNTATEATAAANASREAAQADETARHNTADEAIARQNANTTAAREGREQQQFDATYGQVNKTNPDGTAPANPVAKAIAEYRVPPPSPRTLATPVGQALMNQVSAINPSYDATQYNNRVKTRSAFTTGTQGQQLNAINTAIQHLDLLQQAAAALANGNFTPGNALYNQVRSIFGSAAPTNLATINDAVNGELASVIKKGAATEGEIGRQDKLSSTSSSPEQIAGRVSTAIGLLGGKANSLDFQYRQAMGDKDPMQLLTPEAKAVLEKSATKPATDRVRVKGPNGQTGTVPKGTTLPSGWSLQ